MVKETRTQNQIWPDSLEWLKLQEICGYRETDTRPKWSNATIQTIDYLSCVPVHILKQRAQALEEILGNDRWKLAPALLGQNTETLTEHAQALEEILGNDYWKLAPALLGLKPKTVAKNVLVLRILGIKPTESIKYLLLLSTKTSTKRRKARIIREALLGHQNPKVFWAKDETIDKIKTLFREEKERVKGELRQFPQLVRRKPRLFIQSETALRKAISWHKK